MFVAGPPASVLAWSAGSTSPRRPRRSSGPPAEVLTGEMMSAIYGVPVSIEYTVSGRAAIVPIDR